MAFEDLKIEMKCKDFRIEVEEGLKGESLSIAAQDHTAGCRPCREFNQKHIEFREWLTVCRKVTAPKDFGFGVQRKIAGAGASQTHGWAWNGLRYIVPTAALSAVLVLVGLYAFNSGTIPNSGPGVATLDTNVNKAARTAPDEARVSENIAGPVEPAKPSEVIATSVNANKRENNAPVTVPKETSDPNKGGGSLVQVANKVPPPELPRGLNAPSNDPAGKSKTLIALQGLGVIANLEMTVTRVTGKKAEAAGILIGDVVKSLNGNTVTIERGGQILQITIK
jgi:hypothetical protein